MKNWSLLFTIMMVILTTLGSFKSLPKKDPIMIQGMNIGKYATYVEMNLEISPHDHCGYGTVQLKLWQLVRASRPLQPPQYKWMWVWNSFGIRAEAGSNLVTVRYDFKPGEDFNYEYTYPSFLDPCY